MPLPLTVLRDLAHASLDAIVARWPDDAEPLPERQYVSNGTVVWDCDQLVVMAEATIGTDGNVANEITDPLAYSIRTALIVVLLLRCVPDADVDAADNVISVPTPEEISTSADVILEDSVAVFNALQEAQDAGELAACQGLGFERWTSEGPQGGLGGGSSRIRALLL